MVYGMNTKWELGTMDDENPENLKTVDVVVAWCSHKTHLCFTLDAHGSFNGIILISILIKSQASSKCL